MEKAKLNDNEYAVLSVLAEEWNSEMNCYYFRYLVEKTKLELKVVRRSCRSLAKKGLASYERGLFDLEGRAAGSGYCATRAGAAIISPCDVCGDYITYEYRVDDKGVFGWQVGFDEATAKTVRECDQHHNQSPKLQHSLI